MCVLCRAMAALPPFHVAAVPVTAAELGASWHEGCPVGPAELRTVRVSYVGYDGRSHTGAIVVRQSVAADVSTIFRRLYSARFRQDLKGLPEGGWHPEQRVTGEEALAAFTTGSAFAEFAEERRGTLAVGMDADFVVLSVDPVTAPAAELLKAKVQATVVAGVEVFRAR